jgi:DNA-binding IclR family transcriptional regulator
MSTRLEQAIVVLRLVAARPDPTHPLPLSAIAAGAASTLSTASRLCAELAAAGLLERTDGYGSYRIGPRAVRLSGRAASALASAVDVELHRIAQDTTETVVLAAPEPGGVRVVATVGSGWTLHVPAATGEFVTDPRRAVVRAIAGEDPVVESQVGRAVELAVGLTTTDGRRVAALAVSMPVYRAARARPRVRRILGEARRALERALAQAPRPPAPETAPAEASAPGTVETAARLLEHLARGPATASSAASAAGVRPDRARRALDALVRAGIARRDREADNVHLDLSVHAWYRAATEPLLGGSGPARAAATAAETRACVFVTALKGMRSFTLIEHIEPLGEGLLMAPWLGRPHPLVGSDGGPTLAMDFSLDELATLFPRRHGAAEFARFTARVQHVRAEGVLTMESIDEFGITSVSAPVRDAAGRVAAAACIVGATEDVKPRLGDLETAARALASRLSADLHAPDPSSIPTLSAMGASPIPLSR